jgi:hypothetical protein
MNSLPIASNLSPYYQGSLVNTNLGSILSEYLSDLRHVSYFNLLLAYGKSVTPTTDLFEFFNIDELNRLRNDKDTILCYDCTFEGYSKQDQILANALEYSCVTHNVNPKKIFLFSGNLKEINFKTSINVIGIFLLHLGYPASIKPSINTIHTLCDRFVKKPVLSLSRRNRPHRVWAQFMLNNSSIAKECTISQDRLEDSFNLDSRLLEKTGLTIEDFYKFKQSLPLIADANNFHINSPFDPLTKLHCSTVFSIVNETLANNYNNTSLFFSEKFLKPIVNLQPMLIYGQQGINKKLTMLGFKTYESYFNLDFDEEPDDIIRYKKLLVSATNAVNYLKSLTKEQKVEWRFKNSEILNYNYNIVYNPVHLKNQMIKLNQLIRRATQ